MPSKEVREKLRKQTKLTPKREMFVNEYLKDFNGAQAAIRAGYSPKVARETASFLLTIPHIKQTIDTKAKEIRQEIEKSIKVDLRYVIDQLVINHQLALEKGDLTANNKSLELLGKHFGAFPNNINVRNITLEDVLKRIYGEKTPESKIIDAQVIDECDEEHKE